MLYELVQFSDQVGPLNVFRYISFRAVGATVTALLIVFAFGPMMIDELRVRQGKGQPIREDGPKSHLSKRGTPTMGGLMILLSVLVATLLWSNWRNAYVWLVLGVMLSYGAIGFYDDFLKVTKRSAAGFSGRMRLALEIAVAAIATYVFMQLAPPALSDTVTIPFFKNVLIDLGPFFILFGIIVIAGAGNAVNLTDGLDGLAIVPVMIVAATFGIFAYVVGNSVYAKYLLFPFIPGAGELAVFCGALAGAGLGFLWFNAYPAEVFMGDVGALSIGAALGTVAVITRQEIVLFIMGGVFVAETLSVMVQVLYFKASGGKRIFRMAPLHHHYELGGWKESQVVIRFWIITMMLVLFGLSTLKLR